MPGRNAQVARAFAILQVLDASPQGFTVKELMDRVTSRGHEAKQRTIYRDLELLCQAGFPLSCEPNATDSNASRWKLDSWTRVTEHFILTAPELFALYLARGTLTPLRDTPFFSDLEAVFCKIENCLGTKSSAYLNELASELQFEPGPRWGLGIDPIQLETVRACCAERQVLKVFYSSAHNDQKRVRRLGPHFLYFARGSLYLVAEDLDEKAIKVYAVPRMAQAEMLEEQYSGDPVNPEDYFCGVFGVFRNNEPPIEIKIHFSPKIAPFVKERRWHSSQRIVSKGAGSILFSVEVAITPELVQWVLGFGAEAKVISPEQLVKKVSDAAEKTFRQYQKSAA
ncbi:MAG: WYL domain-containing transcriptional regulator [Deltaproteobacteria bacterium]|nr:WYL domain-containing transcriptional regulator [Deltaproteobacteria bacterium]